MNEQDSNISPPTQAKAKRDRWVKLAFLGATALLVVVIYYLQRRPPQIEGWDKSLPQSLIEARAQNKAVLVLFIDSPPSQADRHLTEKVLTTIENRNAINKSGFVRAQEPLEGGLKSEPAVRYRLKELPTLMVIDSDGNEIARISAALAKAQSIPETAIPAFLASAKARIGGAAESHAGRNATPTTSAGPSSTPQSSTTTRD